MLFRKNIDADCAICRFCAPAGENRIICAKRGMVTNPTPCRKFQYDPLKRTPLRPKAPDFEKHDEDDYSL